MNKKKLISLLYVIYCAGFSHGRQEGDTILPEHGTFDAFNRLISGHSPLEDGEFYNIQDKIELLIKTITESQGSETINIEDIQNILKN